MPAKSNILKRAWERGTCCWGKRFAILIVQGDGGTGDRDRMGQNGTEWDRMGQNGTEWDRMGQNGTEWDRMGQNGTEWDRKRLTAWPVDQSSLPLKALTTAISPAAPAHRVACAANNCKSIDLRIETDNESLSKKDVCLLMRCKTRMALPCTTSAMEKTFQWIALIELLQSIPSLRNLRDADMVICCEHDVFPYNATHSAQHCAAIKVLYVLPLVSCLCSRQVEKSIAEGNEANAKTKTGSLAHRDHWDIVRLLRHRFHSPSTLSGCVCDKFCLHIFSSLLLTCWWTECQESSWNTNEYNSSVVHRLDMRSVPKESFCQWS